MIENHKPQNSGQKSYFFGNAKLNKIEERQMNTWKEGGENGYGVQNWKLLNLDRIEVENLPRLASLRLIIPYNTRSPVAFVILVGFRAEIWVFVTTVSLQTLGKHYIQISVEKRRKKNSYNPKSLWEWDPFSKIRWLLIISI